MRFDIFTLFPEICSAYLQESILKRAQAAGLVSIHLHNIRDYAADRHHVTDDRPYGGGGGILMKREPVFNGGDSFLETPNPKFQPPPLQAPIPIILLTPQ